MIPHTFCLCLRNKDLKDVQYSSYMHGHIVDLSGTLPGKHSHPSKTEQVDNTTCNKALML